MQDCALERVRQQYEVDLEHGAGWVELPGALARKYANAGREWAWQWSSRLPGSTSTAPPASDAGPDPNVVFGVLYDDEQLIVVDKPAGLVVHPARGHATGTLVNGLLARPGFERAAADPRDPAGSLRPGVVHRIDKDTSGVLVVAKTELAREKLKAQLSAHQVERGERDSVERRRDLLVIPLSVLGQHDARSRAPDQRGTGPGLDGSQVTADRSVVAIEVLGCLADAAKACDGIEGAQRLEWRQ